MKVYVMIGTLLIACGSTLAQTSEPSQTGKQSMTMPSDKKMESAQKPHGMPDMNNHMEQMQAEMQQMKARIEKMRSDAEKVKDANIKATLLDNADMWDQFIKHMQEHMGMMKGAGMHHPGMMHGEKPMSPPAGQPSQPNPK